MPVDRIERAAGDDAELVFTGEVVANVAVTHFAWPGVIRILDTNEDRHGVAAAGAEHLSAFLARQLAGGALVAAQVVEIDAGVLVGKGKADAVGGVAINPST